MKNQNVKIMYGNSVLGQKVKLAKSIIDRLVGLMFLEKIDHDQFDGMMIEPCNSVHTCFMKFALDIVFLDENNKVEKIYRSLPPWRFTWINFKTRKILELPSGQLPEQMKVGDVLEVVCIN